MINKHHSVTNIGILIYISISRLITII